MKKVLVVMFVLLVVVGAVVAAWVYRRHRVRGPLHEMRAYMRDEDAPRRIEPSLALRVNEAREASIFVGTPVWFSVGVDNAAAINEVAAAGALSDRLGRLTEDAAKGIVSPQELDRVKAAYERRRAPAKINLGDAARPWTTAVQFFVPDRKGGEKPFSLGLKPLGDVALAVQLDAVTSAQASFGTASATVLPGTYSIVACLGATGSWQGRVCSDAVKLTVLARAEQLSAEQQLALDQQGARFAMLAGDHQPLEKYGRELVAADSRSIEGHFYLGEAKFRQSNWSEALEEFTTARAEFRRQHPHDQSQFMNARINQLLEKIYNVP
jgi:hypothetical protein